jgi:hypothetical protein
MALDTINPTTTNAWKNWIALSNYAKATIQDLFDRSSKNWKIEYSMEWFFNRLLKKNIIDEGNSLAWLVELAKWSWT